MYMHMYTRTIMHTKAHAYLGIAMHTYMYMYMLRVHVYVHARADVHVLHYRCIQMCAHTHVSGFMCIVMYT